MADSTDIQQLIQVLTVRMDRQKGFNARQEKLNERQAPLNVISLDEAWDMKFDIRELRKEITTVKDVVLKPYDERPKRSEDFMDGFMRKAG